MFYGEHATGHSSLWYSLKVVIDRNLFFNRNRFQPISTDFILFQQFSSQNFGPNQKIEITETETQIKTEISAETDIETENFWLLLEGSFSFFPFLRNPKTNSACWPPPNIVSFFNWGMRSVVFTTFFTSSLQNRKTNLITSSDGIRVSKRKRHKVRKEVQTKFSQK